MFHRLVRIEARREYDGDPFFVTDELRIHCEIESGLAQGLTQAVVDIYNLSLENSKALTAADLSPGSRGDATGIHPAERVLIRIYAGYRDEMLANGDLPLILEGLVMNAASRRALPHHITTLWVQPLASQYFLQVFTPFSVPVGTPLKYVLERMCIEAGYAKEGLTFQLPDHILTQDMGGEAFEPDPGLYETLERLGRERSFTVAYRAGGIGFYPRLDDSEIGHEEFNHLQENGDVFYIKPFLLKSAPNVGIATITFTMALDGRVCPGWVIDTADLMGSRGDLALQSNGIAEFSSVGKPLFYTDDVSKYAILTRYMVLKVVHKIDNYQDLWDTAVVGTVPSRGISGQGEQDG